MLKGSFRGLNCSGIVYADAKNEDMAKFIASAKIIIIPIFLIIFFIFYAALKKSKLATPETIPYAEAIAKIPINKYFSMFFAFVVPASSP